MADNDIFLEKINKAMDEQGGSYDRELITKAYNFCVKAHSNQKRKSGEPFYSHPVNVATLLVSLGMDTESIVAALLHDVIEDTEVTLEDVEKEFGKMVVMLVDGVTKLGKFQLTAREQQSENIRKMLIAMAKDIRVIIIKLADRLHNMRTIDSLDEQKQRDKSLETLEVYAPIAHRLGIRAVKEELEDLAIKHLDPVACNEIEGLLSSKKAYREKFLNHIQEKIEAKLKNDVDNIYLEGRVKSIHGIYRKMYVQGKSFDEIYDVYAVRVITDTVNNCYNILGVIHDMFRPIPGRFKDYISTPKPNMYQSLHTTVIGRDAIPFEIQIRTWEMHHTAEYGIAAHWKYKEGIKKTDRAMEERLSWIRQILEIQKEDDTEDVIQTIKTDLAQEDVFAVTPKGDVINLPVGSTIVDFAYAIHSAVGNRMIGAKCDGKIVQLSHEIKTGEIIEILTTSQVGRGPSRDWLNIAKTTQARNKIRSWYKKERRAENIVAGKAELEREFSRNGIRLDDGEYDKLISEVAQRQKCNSVEDFYAAIGYGGILMSRIMPKIKEDYNKAIKSVKQGDVPEFVEQKHIHSRSTEGVVVEGMDNCLVKLSKCCAPLPGDTIIGYITRGHGVSIHKTDCNNVPADLSKSEEPARWVSAHWSSSVPHNFKCTLQLLCIDRPGILADVSVALSNMHVAIHAVNARELKTGNCVMTVTLSIESLEHLKSICAKLLKIDGVLSVDRTNQ
ncbi:MAG: bifunctional (p)ppGpp synthetase/guanosine-3',5'-bis(diphosphate) 3'-pyrophosphohydrolase [bacterium]|nr:bifunctional (p)ppGpp synthetase/guanosine-3',5'-bis(diphosphate) 3'-pyrophosphohydrolase [bacterium]